MPLNSSFSPTQRDLIIDHLHSRDASGNRRSISAMEALGLYRVCSLSSRMCDVQKAGYNIKKIHKRDPTGKRYVRYALA